MDGKQLAYAIERTALDTHRTLKVVLQHCQVHWSTFARWRLGETEPYPRVAQRVQRALEGLWPND